MSYILDALKKAERERDRSRVPTLTTEHPTAPGTGARVNLWVAAGALVAGGLSIWLLRPSFPVVSPAPMESRAPAGAALPAGGVDPKRTTASSRSADTPLPAVAARVPPAPGPGPQPETSRQPSRDPVTAPRPLLAPPPRTAGSGGLPGDGGAARPVESRPVEGMPLEARRADPRPVEQVRAAPRAPEPSVLPQAAPVPVPGAGRPPAGGTAPSPASAPAAPRTLRDAMAKMRLDLFVYSDVKADRMVVISGGKYVEGELVDGLYLLEGITREGAILTYQGERGVLHP
jgi:general secretion pathway protein B